MFLFFCLFIKTKFWINKLIVHNNVLYMNSIVYYLTLFHCYSNVTLRLILVIVNAKKIKIIIKIEHLVKLTVVGEFQVLHERVSGLTEIISGIYFSVFVDLWFESFSHGSAVALYFSVDSHRENVPAVLQSLLNQNGCVFVNINSYWTNETLILPFVSDTARGDLSVSEKEHSWDTISIFVFVVGGCCNTD